MNGSENPQDAANGSEPVAYRLRDAAAKLALGLRTVEGLVASGELNSFKVGKARRVPAAAIDEFLTKRQAASRCACGSNPGERISA